jgi:hypothetical protein
MKSTKQSVGSETTQSKPVVREDGTNSSETGLQKRKKITAVALQEIIPAVVARLNPTTSELEICSSLELSARSETILKAVMYVERTTHIVLADDIRAEIVYLLTDTAWEINLIRGAALMIARGKIKLYNRLNMVIWQEAVRLFVEDAGKRVEAYQQGYRDASKRIADAIERYEAGDDRP